LTDPFGIKPFLEADVIIVNIRAFIVLAYVNQFSPKHVVCPRSIFPIEHPTVLYELVAFQAIKYPTSGGGSAG
jgi:hypothetical protein